MNTSEIERRFVDQCRVARQTRGWSQRELCRQLATHGVHMQQTSVAKLEAPTAKHRRPLTLTEAIALSALLDVPLSRALAGAGESVVDEVVALLEENARQRRSLDQIRAAHQAISEALA